MYPNNNCNDCPDCPGTITPLPLPDLSGLCGDEYNAACVIYTGEDIDCLGIESGMTFLEVLNIFNNALPICDCCEKIPQNCVVSGWGPWGPCECYYEDELLVCGRRKREKTIITPPANGGTPCPPLVEYEPCDVPDVCFTFGSYICDTDPNSTQILESPAGLFNGKPYYLLEFDCEASDLYVWYNSTTLLWHITPVLGTTNALYQTLNNGGNYLPISNNTTQRWSFVEGGNNYLITTQTTTCPDVNICFEFYWADENFGDLTFYANIAPINLGEGSYPIYNWSYEVPEPGGPIVLDITVSYDLTEQKWVFIVQDNMGGDPLIWSTLDTNTFYPFSTTTIEWQSVENIEVYYLEMVSSTQDACVQPPDVDCVWTCTAWSACNAGCTQTRVCTITTQASGNGVCLPSPPTQQSCCEPSCPQPLSPTVVISGTNVLVTFTAVPGAVGYTLTYSATGGNPTSLSSSLPSFSFPWVCGVTYNGSITTNCGTLTSDPTNFIIEIPPCPQPQLCNGDPLRFVLGNVNTPRSGIIKIESAAGDLNPAFPVLNNSSGTQPNNPTFYTSELAQDGIFIGTLVNINVSDQNGAYSSPAIIKLNCSSTSSIFLGEINRTFNAGGSFQAFGPATGATYVPIVRAIKYHKPTNTIYVGGLFGKYKGVSCSRNLVCLDATTGAIKPTSYFKLGIPGIGEFNPVINPEPRVYDIQFDESDPLSTKLVIAGAFNAHTSSTNVVTLVHNIVRINLDGTIDPTFAITNTSFSAQQSQRDTSSGLIIAPSFVKTIYVDAIGDIYAGGAFYTYKGSPAYNIVKIKKNGNKAPSSEFLTGSGFATITSLGAITNSGWFRPWLDGTINYGTPTTTQHGVSVDKIVPHINGILVTGNFAMYNSFDVPVDRANGLIKLNIDGSKDTSFTIDDTTVLPTFSLNTTGRCGYDVRVLNDNSILFAGYLTTYLGTPGGSKGYYILNSDGTVNGTYSFTATPPSGGLPIFFNHIASYFY
jgi:hypothetical protein